MTSRIRRILGGRLWIRMAVEHLEGRQGRHNQHVARLNLDMHAPDCLAAKLILINWQAQKNQKMTKESGTVSSTCMLHPKQRKRDPRGEGQRVPEKDLVLWKVWANWIAV